MAAIHTMTRRQGAIKRLEYTLEQTGLLNNLGEDEVKKRLAVRCSQTMENGTAAEIDGLAQVIQDVAFAVLGLPGTIPYYRRLQQVAILMGENAGKNKA